MHAAGARGAAVRKLKRKNWQCCWRALAATCQQHLRSTCSFAQADKFRCLCHAAALQSGLAGGYVRKADNGQRVLVLSRVEGVLQLRPHLKQQVETPRKGKETKAEAGDERPTFIKVSPPASRGSKHRCYTAIARCRLPSPVQVIVWRQPFAFYVTGASSTGQVCPHL